MKLYQYLLITLCCLINLLCKPLHGYALHTEKNDFLVIDDQLNAGFFAMFNAVLAAINHYDKGKCSGVKVNFDRGTYLDYDKGPNWWEYYFDPINLGNEQGNEVQLLPYDTVRDLAVEGLYFPKTKSYGLIKKYIRVKPHILEEVNHFVKEHFKGYFVIGVHHRGTDKKIEAPIVPYQETFKKIESMIRVLPSHLKKRLKIYVATDEQEFLNYIKDIYPSYVIHSDFVRSSNGLPLHYTTDCYTSNYQKGKEALLDCLLLSKCQWLVYPQTSSFGIAVTKFNPYSYAVPTN